MVEDIVGDVGPTLQLVGHRFCGPVCAWNIIIMIFMTIYGHRSVNVVRNIRIYINKF